MEREPGYPIPPVREDAEAERFELQLGEHLAYLTYTRLDDRFFLLHTEVPQEIGGRGIGSLLLRAALERAREEGHSVVAFCPFARSYLERHPEYADLHGQHEE